MKSIGPFLTDLCHVEYWQLAHMKITGKYRGKLLQKTIIWMITKIVTVHLLINIMLKFLFCLKDIYNRQSLNQKYLDFQYFSFLY